MLWDILNAPTSIATDMNRHGGLMTMKINYKPNPGQSRRSPPRQWEVWLADAAFQGSEKKRRPVVVGKRNGMTWTIYELVPASASGGLDARLSDPARAGQDRPSAVKVKKPSEAGADAFVQKLGELSHEDISKCIAAMR